MPSAYITEDAGSAIKKILTIASKAWTNDKDFRSAKANVQKNNWNKYSSIARLSRDLIMSFPTVCSNVIDPKTASMINKAIERKNVTMIQMVAAAVHLQGFNGKDVVSQLHTNMGINYNVDDYIDNILTFRNMYKESSDETISLSGIPYRVISEEVTRQFQDSMKKVYPANSFNETSILQYEIRNRSQVIISEAKTPLYNIFTNPTAPTDRTEGIKAIEIGRQNNNFDKAIDAVNKAKQAQAREEIDKERNKISRDQMAQSKQLSDREYERQIANDKEIRQRNNRQALQNLVNDKHQYLKQQLMDTDVKKANELQPTLIVLRYQVANSTADSSNVLNYIEDEFVAGVKSRLIAVPSNEIIDRIIDMKKNGASMANLIKATTKETSFTKDFLAGIEMAKIDAKRDSKLSKTNSIWRSLQARSNKSLLKRLTRSANNAAAITTLVLSRQEVDMVKNSYEIDISNPSVAVEFMANYNLMGLVIVDEQTEVASFIYDGDAYFEDLSFTVLEKENNSVSTKQIVNLLNNRR